MRSPFRVQIPLEPHRQSAFICIHYDIHTALGYFGANLLRLAFRLHLVLIMLLIFIAVHLLSQDSIAAPLPHPPDARATTDSCNDSSRTLFSVVWGCLATIFACTWVSVHPNVPPPNQSRPQLFWRRLKMMLIAMIAPEIMVGFAARQFFGSRELANDFKFSSTQAYFFCMGGFVSPTGHPIATREQLKDPDLGPELQEAIRNVNTEEITDKSKGDAFSKGVAVLQGLWFTVQYLARAYQRLTITQLEVATLAFAVVNIFIWLLWWNKPLDVQRPIVVGPPTQPNAENITFPIQLPRLTRFSAMIFGYSEHRYKPLSSVSVPSFWSVNTNNEDVTRGDLLLTLVGALFGAIHCAAWNVVFPTPAEMWIWRISSLVIITVPGLNFLLFLIVMGRGGRLNLILNTVLSVIVLLGFPLYIAARLILIVLPLTELRSLPASAFVDVNWSTYIPHI
ncbi:hypothetical protein MSAN_00630800 [Mycena sanguinolenta]|uniref:Uncharacterized protein n=1 Tax=Mycena sanguinolenta TaxID=230812 RepID=A0A8H6YZP7_9AGAR|nr:hypothetical protein MSAN_00630800 [Mycena sanguinolenta]